MKRLFAVLVAASMLPAAAHATNCTTRNLAGRWMINVGAPINGGAVLHCDIRVRTNGAAAGRCRAQDLELEGARPNYDSDDVEVSGTMRLNSICTLSGELVVPDVTDNLTLRMQLEGRAWATAAQRPDALSGVAAATLPPMAGVPHPIIFALSGHRRPAAVVFGLID